MTTLQQRVWQWVRGTFGPVAENQRERALRVLEEANEFAQAAGVDEGAAVQVVARVYGRPRDPSATAEMGALGLTAMAWCELNGYQFYELVEAELDRCLSKPREHWRAKHDAKVATGIVTGKAN